MESHLTKGQSDGRIKEEAKPYNGTKKVSERKAMHERGKISLRDASLDFNSTATPHSSGSLLLDKEVMLSTNPQNSFVSEAEKISVFSQGSTDKIDSLISKDPATSNFLVYVDDSTGSLIQQVVPGTIIQASAELPQMQVNSEVPARLSYFCGNVLETDKIRPSMALTEQPMAVVFDPNLPKQGQQQIYVDSSSLVDFNQSVVLNSNGTVAVGKEGDQTLNEVLVTSHSMEEPTQDDKNFPTILMASEEENNGQSANDINFLPISSVHWEGQNRNLTDTSVPNNHVKVDLKEMEELKAQQRQIDQRNLEQSHLAHQTNLIHQRSRSKKDVLIRKSSLEEHLKNVGIDDSTPIFTSVSAILNPLIINHLPGCQQFLLNDSSASSKISKVSSGPSTEWSFQGSFTELTSLHNAIKSLMHLKSQTNCNFQIIGNDKNKKEDKSVYCNILAPYISSKGRISKQSMKAKQAEAILGLDDDLLNYGEDANFMEDSKSPKKTWRKRRMHNIHKKKKPFSSLTVTSNLSSKTIEDSHCALTDSSAADEGKGQGESNESDNKSSADPDLSDPLQERLRQEQIKYRQILDNANKFRQLKSILIESSRRAGSEQNITDASEEKSTGTSKDVTSRKKKGRPPKEYDPSEDLEKVNPRNPLTESDSTKQQRKYEEHVAFKFFCKQCSFKTKRKSHFDTHLQCHEKYPNTRHSCGVCDYVSLSLPALRRHELKHKKNILRCEICTVYKTDKKYLMQRHIKIKHSNLESQPKFTCDQCSAEFSSSYRLTRHQATHIKSLFEKATENIKFTCSQCKKDFRQSIHLRRHVRDVHGPEIRPHLCDKCGKSFKRTDALQQHKMVHSAPCARKFPFKCVECNKSFRSQAHLKEHMSVHSTDRPFLCHYCGAAFKTQPVQKKHILTLHIRPRTHVCSVCCRQFNTKNALLKHENIHKPPEETLVGEKNDEYIAQETQEHGIGIVAKGNSTSLKRQKITSALVIDISSGAGVVFDQDNNMTSNIIHHSDIGGSANPSGVIARPSVQESVAQQQDCIHDSQTGQTFYYLTH